MKTSLSMTNKSPTISTYLKNTKRHLREHLMLEGNQFPTKNLWDPPFEVSHREFVTGPQCEIVIHKKITVVEDRTKRKIVYSSAEYEHFSSRHKFSYVQRKTSNDYSENKPTLG